MTKLSSIIRACICSPIILLGACNLNSITDSANNIDGESITPEVIESREGARWVYLGAVAKFAGFFGSNALAVSQFTDELSLLPNKVQNPGDARIGQNEYPYVVNAGILDKGQTTRVQLQQALQLINRHYGSSGNAMKAHSHALLGLVYIMIADTYCSGIAISESNYGGEFIPGQGISRDSLYMLAVASAENGLALGVDSLPLNYLLKGVKARALNSSGYYENAAEVISDVPNTFFLGETFSFLRSSVADIEYHPHFNGSEVTRNDYHVLNGKGFNGLTWVADSSRYQDMRVAVRVNTTGNYVYPLQPEFFFAKRRIAFFSGAEARLIEAEYHLSKGNIADFIEMINSVRRMYKQRSGSVLPDTVDPGSHSSRVDLLFKERAYTFYMAGRRLGDMRRLTRYYDREPDTVWPTGRSEGQQFITYANNYFFVPEVQGQGAEATRNPNYNACDSYEI